jgi:hypothetical protein
MQIGIKHVDYIYLWNVRKKDQNKVFFRINGQIYKVYRSELRRLFDTKYGENAGTDDIIMYIDDAIQPYHPRGMNYDQDATLEDIDNRKLTYKKRLLGGGAIAKLGAGLSGAWWPLLVIAIFGGIVALAFLNGGA